MTIAEFRRKQKEEEERKKLMPMQKISNNFLDNTIFKNHAGALKTIFYLSTKMRDMKLDRYNEDELINITIDFDEFVKYSNMDVRILKRSVKQMQETSISFITTEEKNGSTTIKSELYINLLPSFEIIHGKKLINAKIFVKIARLIADVSDNWTYLNTKSFMQLDSKHSIRLLGLLNKIDTYDYKLEATQTKKELPKVKKMTLEELNEFFGTRYKNWNDIERKIIKPTLEELDSKSPLTFTYDVEYKAMSKGRPKFEYIKIYCKNQKGVQTRLANFID